jgi:hypothetical protein
MQKGLQTILFLVFMIVCIAFVMNFANDTLKDEQQDADTVIENNNVPNPAQ